MNFRAMPWHFYQTRAQGDHDLKGSISMVVVRLLVHASAVALLQVQVPLL